MRCEIFRKTPKHVIEFPLATAVAKRLRKNHIPESLPIELFRSDVAAKDAIEDSILRPSTSRACKREAKAPRNTRQTRTRNGGFALRSEFTHHRLGIWVNIGTPVCTSVRIGALGKNPVADVLHWRIPKQSAVLPAEL